MGKIAKTGIFVVFGIPGSGKSYALVRNLLDEVASTYRPVYTNLHLKFGPIRAFLYRHFRYKRYKSKGESRVLANLIRPLTRDHFDRFCKRLAWIDAEAERIKDSGDLGEDAGSFSDKPSFVDTEARRLAMARADSVLGPTIITGKGANWIPPKAILYLDELHKWYGNAQIAGKEPLEILAYTSMHRHMQHLVYVISQRAMNISISFRAMAKEFWKTDNLENVRAFWFFKFPVQIFRLLKFYTNDIQNGEPAVGAEPVGYRWFFPYLRGSVFFRLYESHSHMGSEDEAENQRLSILNEVDPTGRLASMKIPRTFGGHIVDIVKKACWPLKTWRRWLLLVFVFLLGALYGPRRDMPPEVVFSPPVAVVEGPSEEPKPLVFDFTITGVSSSGVFVDGDFIPVGESIYEALELVQIDPVSRWSVWRLGGFMFMRHPDGSLRADHQFMERLAYFRETGDRTAFLVPDRE